MTGAWVRVLASAEQVRKERDGMEQAAKAGLVKLHPMQEADQQRQVSDTTAAAWMPG
ncbi:MAG: hypothetical protein ACKOZT_09575 [Cyanobium sp.]